jgi:inner membrane protein
MFIAHLPAGYLITRYYLCVMEANFMKSSALKYYVMFGLFCSVLPDFDLIYFYLIDNRQHAHHSYWTHIPMFWVLLSVSLYCGAKVLFKQNVGPASVILLVNTQLHMLLDSVAGGIYWLYPLYDEKYRLFDVTSRFDWWVWNFVLHWTFLLELLIIIAAAYLVLADRKLMPIKEAAPYDS